VDSAEFPLNVESFRNTAEGILGEVFGLRRIGWSYGRKWSRPSPCEHEIRRKRFGIAFPWHASPVPGRYWLGPPNSDRCSLPLPSWHVLVHHRRSPGLMASQIFCMTRARLEERKVRVYPVQSVVVCVTCCIGSPRLECICRQGAKACKGTHRARQRCRLGVSPSVPGACAMPASE